MNYNIGIIILAAGIGKRMNAYGPKSTIKISKNQTVIERQIKLIKKYFDVNNIVVVVGFQKSKVLKLINVKFVENKKYKTTNTSASVNIAFKNKEYSKVLIIYGDIVFTNEIFLNMPDESWVAVDNDNNQRSEEVGINIIDNHAIHFSYGINPKWGHIVMLTGKELSLYKYMIENIYAQKKFCFEIFNQIIDSGGKFKIHTNKKWKIVEIDTSKDINRAINLVQGDSL